jgi:hypothetical protein
MELAWKFLEAELPSRNRESQSRSRPKLSFRVPQRVLPSNIDYKHAIHFFAAMNADTEKRNKDVRDKELRDKARAEEARAWTPNPDPSTIVIPGLDTTAPISAQLEYVEQMITLRMQV